MLWTLHTLKMAGNRRNRQSKRQSKVKVPKTKCDICSKEFSSLSSLNSHKKTKHEGRGWKCPLCQLTLVSKHGLIRHTQRAHRTKKLADLVATAQEHEVFVKDDVAEMSEAAKSALIVKLRLKVDKKDKVIAALKFKLKNYIEKKTGVEGDEEESLSNVEEEEENEEEVVPDEEEEHESEEDNDDDENDGQASNNVNFITDDIVATCA